MKKLINTKALNKEIRNNKFVYFLLTFILGGGLFFRVYRIYEILGFYFDQGRDALVIWNFWHHGDLFLIGPTTGIAGIFRGPFYYYLIAPFYLLGGGDPIWPSIFLSITTIVAAGFAYYLASRVQNKTAGLLAAFVTAFSFFMIKASVWLSNPTPMLLLSMILIWLMFLILDGKKWAWIGIGIVSGLSLFHFGSSGEFFYFPALLIFAIWKRKTLDLKTILISGFSFFLTATPLILFDIRNENLLSNNFMAFLTKDETFESSFIEVVKQRLSFYRGVFTGKIFVIQGKLQIDFIKITYILTLVSLPKLIRRDEFKILLLILLSPLIGLLFFQGNNGNIYDYYLTGYYLVFIILFAVVLGSTWKYKIGKIFVAIFLYAFFLSNAELVWHTVNDRGEGPTTISYGNQKRAIEWVYADAKSEQFNNDVYVPPVIPHAYDYLFTWIDNDKKQMSSELIPLLYTIYEEDPPHPERLKEWMDRQEGIGIVEREAKFGGITAQRRMRIPPENE